MSTDDHSTASKRMMTPNGMFEQTQDYYARFRPPITDDVAGAVLKLSGPEVMSGSLLDLGTGTGQVVRAMAPHFVSIYAIELDQGMLDRAEADWQASEYRHKTEVEWARADVEEYSLPPTARVTLTTACRAFHWMDQASVLRRYATQTASGASFAVFGDSSFWESPQDWAIHTKQTVQSFLGEQRKARSGTFNHHKRPYADILTESPFSLVREAVVQVERTWTPAQVIGYLYSTTFAARELFGNRRTEFEDTLTNSLLPYQQNGQLLENAHFKICVGTKPE